MNTQNIKTAATETPKTWGKGPEIRGISPALAETLTYLKVLRENRMTLEDRAEVLCGTLINLTEQLCDTVTDWERLRPVMPIASWCAWAEAKRYVLGAFGETGEAAWNYARGNLEMLLSAGYEMKKADIW